MTSDVTHVDRRRRRHCTGKPPRLPGRPGMAIKALRAAATPDAAGPRQPERAAPIARAAAAMPAFLPVVARPRTNSLSVPQLRNKYERMLLTNKCPTAQNSPPGRLGPGPVSSKLAPRILATLVKLSMQICFSLFGRFRSEIFQKCHLSVMYRSPAWIHTRQCAMFMPASSLQWKFSHVPLDQKLPSLLLRTSIKLNRTRFVYYV